jgi:peptide deformylase
MILLDTELSKDISTYATKDEAVDIISKLEWELQHSAVPGIGLAAPQIGINKAVAIIRVRNPFDPTDPVTSINLVNPRLTAAHDLVQYNEGCLSFPGLSAKTVRYDEIVIETQDDYEYYSEHINARRYNRTPRDLPLFTNERRLIQCGQGSTQPEIKQIEQLVCICVQHEFSHLLGLTMYDFKPQEVGRNDSCPCGSGKKNKKCHNSSYYNKNLEKLFSPKYPGA